MVEGDLDRDGFLPRQSAVEYFVQTDGRGRTVDA